MGYGSYSQQAHIALVAGRSVDTPVFEQRRCHSLLDPHGAVRACHDSADHPQALGIVFAFDVSGSMGDIPRVLATQTLPRFMGSLQAAPIHDAQVCFMAIGHASDRSPLQVGQFESTEGLIDHWLTLLHLEGGGVGQHECYELAMWFAAHRMQLDCVDKRGRRGFFFLTVDTAPNPALSRLDAARILGEPLPADLPIREVIDSLQRQVEPFVFVAPGSARGVERSWRDLLGDRVIVLQHHEDVALVAAGLIALLHGSAPSLPAYIRTLRMGRRRSARVARALVAFAASVHRDGAPLPHGDKPRLPRDRASGMDR